MTNKQEQENLQQLTCEDSCQGTKAGAGFAHSGLCHSSPQGNQTLLPDLIDVHVLIWRSVRLGEELFQNHTLVSLLNTSPDTAVHRGER